MERAGQLPEQMVIKALRMSHYQREQQRLSSQNATAHPYNVFITAAANYVRFQALAILRWTELKAALLPLSYHISCISFFFKKLIFQTVHEDLPLTVQLYQLYKFDS